MTNHSIRLGITAACLLALTLACNLPIPTGSPPAEPPAPANSGQPNAPAPTETPLQPATITDSKLTCFNETCLARSSKINYLIVTRPLFLDALITFVNWKADNNFSVGVVTVDWLADNFQGRHLAEQVKAGIHHLRREAGIGGSLYVLLVGDTEIELQNFNVSAVMASYNLSQPWNVPTGFYRRIHTDPPNEVLPSDAYYVEDRDWDPQNTGLNPVPEESGQGKWVNDIFIGRWSVRTPDEVARITQKTLAVRPTTKILFAEDKESYTPSRCIYPPNSYTGERAYAACYLNSEEIRNRVLGQYAPWIQMETLFVDPQDNAQVDAFEAKLFNYDGAVSTVFHGNYDCLYVRKGNCWQINEMPFKSTFSLFDSSSCSIGAFYAGTADTLAESILKHPNGPAVVTQAGHNQFHFFEHLKFGMPVGVAFWDAGREYVYWLNPILLLGDPSLIIFEKT